MQNLLTPTTAKLKSNGILSNWGVHENDWRKGSNTKQSWCKSNSIVVGSNFNSPCYNTQAGKMSG